MRNRSYGAARSGIVPRRRPEAEIENQQFAIAVGRDYVQHETVGAERHCLDPCAGRQFDRGRGVWGTRGGRHR